MSREFSQMQQVLAEQVKARRGALGLSQEKLALDADVDRTYVSQIERGIGNPSLKVLCRLALVLGTDVVALLNTTRR